MVFLSQTVHLTVVQDATYLAGVIKEAQDMLPDLRQEYEEVMRQLEQEQADIDEIENSDKDYLNELKATIAEQRYASSLLQPCLMY